MNHQATDDKQCCVIHELVEFREYQLVVDCGHVSVEQLDAAER